MSGTEVMQELCDKFEAKYDKMKHTLMWINGIILSIYLSVGGAQILSFGQIKKQVEINTESLHFMQKDYVPAWFLEGMINNMNYQTEEIIATVMDDKERIKRINEKYSTFQKDMMNNLIRYRGGQNYITRGGTIKQN